MKHVTRFLVDGEAAGHRVVEGEEQPAAATRWIDLGDYVLVDPRAYFEPRVDAASTHVEQKRPFVWGKVTHIAPGTASVYPIKVTFDPEAAGFAAVGQYKTTEVLAIQHGEAEAEYWRDTYNWGT